MSDPLDLVLTIELFGDFDLRRNAMSVERTTDINGVAREIQESFGFLMLCEKKKGSILLFMAVIAGVG